MRFRLVAASLLAVGAVIVIACVGDDPGSGEGDGGIAPGDRGGPCKNGVCLAGLTCLDNVCVLVDGGSSLTDGGGNDTGANDGGSDAAQEAAACPPPSASLDTIKCGGNNCNAQTQECCFVNGTLSCESRGSCNGVRIGCDSFGANDCPDSGACCVLETFANSVGQCPSSLAVIKEVRCALNSTICNSGETMVCNTAAQCGVQGQECKGIVMSQANLEVQIGVCTK